MSVLIHLIDLDADPDNDPPMWFVVDGKEVSQTAHSRLRDLVGDGSPVIVEEDENWMWLLSKLGDGINKWKHCITATATDVSAKQTNWGWVYSIRYKSH